MKIAIIGHGVVGQHVEELIKNHYDYCIYDPNYPLISVIKEFVNEFCELAVICVPTPQAEDGSCDTSIVEETVKWLETPLILIKSTVEPGTVDELRKKTGKHLIFGPEYTGESKYYNPIMKTMKEEPFVIFGGNSDDTQAMVDIYKPILGPLVKYVQCTAIEAELAKYMENTFFATKVSFFNEFYDICKAYEVSYDRVRELFLNDPRINRMHTSVFLERGWSGKCFPKDICAIIQGVIKCGYTPQLLIDVVKANARHSTNKEMQDLPKTIENG